MSATRCPACQLPLTDAEAGSGACPMCAAPLVVAEPTLPSKPEPPKPPVAPFWLHERFLLFVALLLCVLLGGALFSVMRFGQSEIADLRAVNQQQAEQLATMTSQLAESHEALKEWKQAQAFNEAQAQTNAARQKMLEAQVAMHLERVRHLEQERKELEPELAEWRAIKDTARKVIPNMPAFPEGATHILALDRPDAEYRISALTTNRVVKVTGKLKTLRVEHISGATLDASELEVTDIIFGSGVGNKAKVKLKSNKGTITLPYVDTQAQIDIVAPEGKVDIVWVNNSATVNVTARNITLRDYIDGKDTTINATVTTGGKLRFRELRGLAHLLWKKSLPTDPDVMIEAGKIGPQAEFRELPAGK